MKKYSLANLCLYANEVAPAKSDFAFTAIADISMFTPRLHYPWTLASNAPPITKGN